jgi:hypothetical protein
MYTLSKIADVNSNQPRVIEHRGGVEEKLIIKSNWLGTYSLNNLSYIMIT